MSAGGRTHHRDLVGRDPVFRGVLTHETDGAARVEQFGREAVRRYAVVHHEDIVAVFVEKAGVPVAFVRRTASVSAAGEDHHGAVVRLVLRAVGRDRRDFAAGDLPRRTVSPKREGFCFHILCFFPAFRRKIGFFRYPCDRGGIRRADREQNTG